MKLVIAALVAAIPLFTLAAGPAPGNTAPARPDKPVVAQAKDVAAKAGLKSAKDDCKTPRKPRKSNRDPAKV